MGFPDETDEDFENTFNFLKEIKFYKMHIFKYSKREGTIAAKMKNQIQGDIKEARSKRLIELSNINEKSYLDSYIGKGVDVLFEERENKFLKGHTGNYILVKFECEEDKINKIVKVKIKESGDEFLIG